jgi:phosphonate utilization transcriptional regulator
MKQAPSRPGSIALLQSQSLTTLAQKEIERLILSGEIGAGEKLSENAIAFRLGVSRGPVREAFRALEESGLVRMEKNRGVFVRVISLEEADEISQVREALEELIGRLLAGCATREQVEDLRGIADRMEKAMARKQVETYDTLDFRFHDRMVELTGNRKLMVTYRRLVRQLMLYRRNAPVDRELLPRSIIEHRAIVDKIAAGDAEAAGRAMRRHAVAGRQRMRRDPGTVRNRISAKGKTR